jgi:hypothetical protein
MYVFEGAFGVFVGAVVAGLWATIVDGLRDCFWGAVGAWCAVGLDARPWGAFTGGACGLGADGWAAPLWAWAQRVEEERARTAVSSGSREGRTGASGCGPHEATAFRPAGVRDPPGNRTGRRRGDHLILQPGTHEAIGACRVLGEWPRTDHAMSRTELVISCNYSDESTTPFELTTAYADYGEGGKGLALVPEALGQVRFAETVGRRSQVVWPLWAVVLVPCGARRH